MEETDIFFGCYRYHQLPVRAVRALGSPDSLEPSGTPLEHLLLAAPGIGPLEIRLESIVTEKLSPMSRPPDCHDRLHCGPGFRSPGDKVSSHISRLQSG